MTNEPTPTPINPAALSVSDTARLLSKIGTETIAETVLEADVECGAPTNADGTLNLVHYAAWLVKEMSRGE